MTARLQYGLSSPAAWYERFPAPVAGGHADGQTATSEKGGHPARSMLRRFKDIDGAFEQPPLNAHTVAFHLGGAKRVQRTQGRRHWTKDVALGSMTLMPAYQANSWHTEGPIDFAHLTISLGLAEQIVVEEFDREPATHQLHETLGVEDRLLEQVFHAMLEQLEQPSFSPMHMDALLRVFTVRLFEQHSTLSARPGAVAQRRGGLAGWQLRRVVDHLHAHLGEKMALSGLAELTGLSRAHFFRAFRQSTGRSPGSLLAEIRMRQARRLLTTTSLEVEEIGTSLGFSHARHFASAFGRRVGVSPRLFRASQG